MEKNSDLFAKVHGEPHGLRQVEVEHRQLSSHGHQGGIAGFRLGGISSGMSPGVDLCRSTKKRELSEHVSTNCTWLATELTR